MRESLNEFAFKRKLLLLATCRPGFQSHFLQERNTKMLKENGVGLCSEKNVFVFEQMRYTMLIKDMGFRIKDV